MYTYVGFNEGSQRKVRPQFDRQNLRIWLPAWNVEKSCVNNAEIMKSNIIILHRSEPFFSLQCCHPNLPGGTGASNGVKKSS